MAGAVIGGTLTDAQKTYLEDMAQSNKSNRLKLNQDMGRDQFLHILLTQLANQNPLDPMQDKEFIAQMAQFSSVESMQALNDSFDVASEDIAAIKQSIDIMQKGQLSSEQLALLQSMERSLNSLANPSVEAEEVNRQIGNDKAAAAYE